mmetsp:Transcript_645/g.959  ORF Transcript_645/g.959 Transcript_645/m.959 type:complete len:271 (-) Transcript_645:507-1319(-)
MTGAQTTRCISAHSRKSAVHGISSSVLAPWTNLVGLHGGYNAVVAVMRRFGLPRRDRRHRENTNVSIHGSLSILPVFTHRKRRSARGNGRQCMCMLTHARRHNIGRVLFVHFDDGSSPFTQKHKEYQYHHHNHAQNNHPDPFGLKFPLSIGQLVVVSFGRLDFQQNGFKLRCQQRTSSSSCGQFCVQCVVHAHCKRRQKLAALHQVKNVRFVRVKVFKFCSYAESAECKEFIAVQLTAILVFEILAGFARSIGTDGIVGEYDANIQFMHG